MVRRTNPQHRSQPVQEPALPYAPQPLCGVTQAHIVEDRGEGYAYNRGFGVIGA